jgi:hypothetical protein
MAEGNVVGAERLFSPEDGGQTGWVMKMVTLGTSHTNPPRDSITFNDQSQSLIQAGTVFQTQFAWASDVPTGTVLLGQSAQITSNSLDNRAFVSNHGKDLAQYDANDGGQIRIHDQIMSSIAGDLVTTTASTATSINYAGQSQRIADGKLDAAARGQTGDFYLEDRYYLKPLPKNPAEK